MRVLAAEALLENRLRGAKGRLGLVVAAEVVVEDAEVATVDRGLDVRLAELARERPLDLGLDGE